MNKIEIKKGIFRQNVYNVNLDNGHYNHITCYFDIHKNIIAVFKAGDNTNMTNFYPCDDLTPFNLSDKLKDRIKSILSDWTYNHIQAVDLYNPDSIWHREGMKGIFEITKRDLYVIKNYL